MPEEAAGPMLFLASPLSNDVSGIVLEVTGVEQSKLLRDKDIRSVLAEYNPIKLSKTVEIQKRER